MTTEETTPLKPISNSPTPSETIPEPSDGNPSDNPSETLPKSEETAPHKRTRKQQSPLSKTVRIDIGLIMMCVTLTISTLISGFVARDEMKGLISSVETQETEILALKEEVASQRSVIRDLQSKLSTLEKENEELKEKMKESNTPATIPYIPYNYFLDDLGKYLSPWLNPDGVDGEDEEGFLPSNQPETIQDHGYLGIEVRETDDGVVVEKITRSGPSDFKVGDRIVSVNDQKVKNFNDLKKIIQEKSVGDVVEVRVSRNGKEGIFEVKLIENPSKKQPELSEKL